jgi:hypothetical protein
MSIPLDMNPTSRSGQKRFMKRSLLDMVPGGKFTEISGDIKRTIIKKRGRLSGH